MAKKQTGVDFDTRLFKFNRKRNKNMAMCLKSEYNKNRRRGQWKKQYIIKECIIADEVIKSMGEYFNPSNESFT